MSCMKIEFNERSQVCNEQKCINCQRCGSTQGEGVKILHERCESMKLSRESTANVELMQTICRVKDLHQKLVSFILVILRLNAET